MLIATLPAVYESRLISSIVEHPLVGGVRYNVGASSPYEPQETLERVMEVTTRANKPLWVDLKGRQLRITAWSYPRHGGEIRLNHTLDALPGARVYFRGDQWSELKVVRGDTIWVDPPPRSAVGAGQSINIVGDDVEVHGYLTPEDRAYALAAARLGLTRFMLSFVETSADVEELAQVIRGSDRPELWDTAQCVLKIESRAGLDHVASMGTTPRGQRLMAARDDMMINIGEDKTRMMPALRSIISVDPDAICASRLLGSLERTGVLSMGDMSDVCLMWRMGYRHFLLSDGLCHRRFDKAIAAWGELEALLV